MAEQSPEPDDTGLPALTDQQLADLADYWGLDATDLQYPTTPAPDDPDGEQPRP